MNKVQRKLQQSMRGGVGEEILRSFTFSTRAAV